ncbi:hypothetical protein BDN70DRAFT_671718 [Pholiota conissans]|uniref:Uncharacterized protein n=1 Tax=Pholiota conissans TaxID=109636 RepID=A0A9P6D0Y1_9AGAR|nr:hypothetical protein BDN70DRAFT_671718 [Pholiota conissans]
MALSFCFIAHLPSHIFCHWPWLRYNSPHYSPRLTLLDFTCQRAIIVLLHASHCVLRLSLALFHLAFMILFV